MSLVSTLRPLRSGLSFWASADGGVNWIGRQRPPMRSRLKKPLLETDGQASGGFLLAQPVWRIAGAREKW